jgi:hypothetical protein
MWEQEEIAQFLRQQYGDKKLPNASNQLRVGQAKSYVTLDTGTWNGQLTVVGLRFHDGKYELRDYEDRVSTYETLDQMKQGVAVLLNSLKDGQLDRLVDEARRRARR